MDAVNEVFELLAVSAKKANDKALELLKSAQTSEDRDSINWARAYALVELKSFDEAFNIWQDIFERTESHKALHQMGFVHRSANNLTAALDIFVKERSLIELEDTQANAINLYELAYCNFLLGSIEKSLEYFNQYEALNLDEDDLIERGCFFRLKGDIYKTMDRNIAKAAYEKSLGFFDQAEDKISSVEVKALISALGSTSRSN